MPPVCSQPLETRTGSLLKKRVAEHGPPSWYHLVAHLSAYFRLAACNEITLLPIRARPNPPSSALPWNRRRSSVKRRVARLLLYLDREQCTRKQTIGLE